AETSIWEMGGIRWKAAGEPRRMGHCGTCERTFWGQVYRRAEQGAPHLTSLGGPEEIGDNAVHQVATGWTDAKGAAAAETAGSRDNDRRHSAMTNPRSAIELSRTAA